jgi:hypothetical protein
MEPNRRIWMSSWLTGILVLAIGCQPAEEEEPEIDPGAIPAAPDARPGTEPTPDAGLAPDVFGDTLPAAPEGVGPPATPDTS